MTIKDVEIVSNAFIENKEIEVKSIKANTYNQAYLTTLFIGKMLGGKSIPKIEEVFPELSTDVQESPQKEVVDNSWIIIKERMIDFANEANKRMNK